MKRFVFFLAVLIFVGGLFVCPNNVAGEDKEYTIIRITDDNYFEEWPSIDDDGNNIAFGRRSLTANFYDIVKKNLVTGQEVVLFKSKLIKDPNIRYFKAKKPVISGNGEFVAYLIETYTGNLIGINEKIFELDGSMFGYPADLDLRIYEPLDVSYEGVVIAPVNVGSKTHTPMIENWGYPGQQATEFFTVLIRVTPDGKASVIYGPSLYKKSDRYEVDWGDRPRLCYRYGWPQTYSLGEGKLVFPGEDKNGDLGLYILDIDTATINKIVSSNVFRRAAQISRNGQRVFFIANLGTHFQLAYIDIKTGKVSEIASRKFGKIFTSDTVPEIRSFYRYADPTGNKVVFGIYSNRTLESLYIMNIDGTEEKEIVTVGKNDAPNIIDWYGGKCIANSGRAIILKGRNSYFNDGGDLYLFKLGEVVQTGATFPPAEKGLEEEKRISTIADFDDFKWQDEWHDPQGNTYTYRMAVDIFSEVEAAWYQLAITLDPKSFNYPHAQPEGRDIRFVAEREGKLFELPYWIEKWNPKGESKVWVKVPLIRDTVKVYLYYGNSEVSSKSSGKDVFEYFDDFSEFADWSVYGNKPTVATMGVRKVIEMRGPSEIVRTIKLESSSYAFESLSKLTSGMEAYMPFLGFGSSNRSGDEDNAYQFGYNVWAARHVDNIRIFKDESEKINVAGDPAYSGRSGWVRSRFTVYNGKLTQVIHDETKGTQEITAQDTHWTENTPKEVGIIVWDGASYAIDWLFIRNYLEPEPTYILGSEEKRPVKEPLEPAGIVSLIRACQKSISEQSEIIRQLKREIELLKTRINQLEERIEELSKKELPRQVINIQGVWDTNWGETRLIQSGVSVTGTYAHDNGRIKGTIRGNVLIGKWSEAPSYSEPHDAGDVELELSEDGNSFSGRWRYGSSGEWDGVWTGTRVEKH